MYGYETLLFCRRHSPRLHRHRVRHGSAGLARDPGGPEWGVKRRSHPRADGWPWEPAVSVGRVCYGLGISCGVTEPGAPDWDAPSGSVVDGAPSFVLGQSRKSGDRTLLTPSLSLVSSPSIVLSVRTSIPESPPEVPSVSSLRGRSSCRRDRPLGPTARERWHRGSPRRSK